MPTHLVIGKRMALYARAPMQVRCHIVRIEAQHVVLRAPDGAEVWAQRCDGELTGPKGGRASGSRPLPAQWKGWTVMQWHALPWFYAETPNR